MFNLSDFRKKIDFIDLEILKLLAARNEILPEIITYKQKHNLPILQSGRENEIMKEKLKLAKKLKLSPQYIESILDLILSESRRIQVELNTQKNNSNN